MATDTRGLSEGTWPDRHRQSQPLGAAVSPVPSSVTSRNQSHPRSLSPVATSRLFHQSQESSVTLATDGNSQRLNQFLNQSPNKSPVYACSLKTSVLDRVPVIHQYLHQYLKCLHHSPVSSNFFTSHQCLRKRNQYLPEHQTSSVGTRLCFCDIHTL